MTVNDTLPHTLAPAAIPVADLVDFLAVARVLLGVGGSLFTAGLRLTKYEWAHLFHAVGLLEAEVRLRRPG